MHLPTCLLAFVLVAASFATEIDEHHFNNTKEKDAEVGASLKEDVRAEVEKEDKGLAENGIEEKLEEISRTPHGEQDPGKRRKKSATTTFCVEIRPGGAETKPFQICETPEQQKPQPPPQQHYQPQPQPQPQQGYQQQTYQQQHYQSYQQQLKPQKALTIEAPQELPQQPAKNLPAQGYGASVPVKVYAPIPAAAVAPKPYNSHYREAKEETAEVSAAKAAKVMAITSRAKEVVEEKEEHHERQEAHHHEDEHKQRSSYGGEQYIPATSYIPMAHNRPNRPSGHHSGHNGLVITCQPNLAGFAHNVPSSVHHPPATTYYRSSTSRSYGPYGRPHAPVRPVYGYYPPRPQPQHQSGSSYSVTQQQEVKVLPQPQAMMTIPQEQPAAPQQLLPEPEPQRILPAPQPAYGAPQQQPQRLLPAPQPIFELPQQQTFIPQQQQPLRILPAPQPMIELPQPAPQETFAPQQQQKVLPAPQTTYGVHQQSQRIQFASTATQQTAQLPSAPAPVKVQVPVQYHQPSYSAPSPHPSYPAPQPSYSAPAPQPAPSYQPQAPPQQQTYVPSSYREAEQRTKTEEQHTDKESHTIKKMEQMSKERAAGSQWAKDQDPKEAIDATVQQWSPVMRSTGKLEHNESGLQMMTHGEHGEHGGHAAEGGRKTTEQMVGQMWSGVEEADHAKENEVADA
ncbi:unnamed protein product [Acanthoscelides obtectus]|uniref:Uncharacterized protein n=1 Tax=Acanthoscelides obtectus TaxID=200917 RepID=A0A9P0K2K9_ACAOB|nr:unnamed protein product [Acanthoscelides obtectus]CAK1620234.1 hypothetical protein AOBTE_LOCUS254 [Acanthoscelides obtectus]